MERAPARTEGLDEHWQTLIEDVATGMRQWRQAHPRATFREIQAALDERLDRVRARMLEEAALASPAADLAGQPAAERPPCAECGGPLDARGRQAREVTVRGGRAVRLRRSYAVCRACGAGVFPPG
jgi:hypothetical protein